MSRVVITTPCTLPAVFGAFGQPAQYLTKGMVIEVTAAQVAAIAAQGGTTRTVSASQHDALGEGFGVSNSG